MSPLRSSVLVALALSVLAPTAVSAADTPPNLLVIMVDDLGYGDLGSYGAPDVQSPHIDALVTGGLKFTGFYANCPVCSPTRAALLTGLYPDNAGVPGVIRTPLEGIATNWGDLRDDVPLLPELLGSAGYHTACVGKWHLGLEAPDRPHDRGFDHFHGFLGDMMDDYYEHRRHGNNYMRHNDEIIDPEGHATDLFSDWAIEYIRGRESEKPDQPWFLYLAYNAPHTPIQPPADWLERVRQRDPAMPEPRAKLVALIEHMDHGIGQVTAALDELGIEEETLVVFTSDNGGQSNVGARNLPFRGGKQEMWEGGLRVATCATWPGTIAAGTTTDHHGLTMDLFPTLLAMAGAEVPEGLDGRSFAPLLTGGTLEPEDPERPLFWVRLEGNQKYGGLPYHAVRRGDWKLLRNTPFEPYQLFNLANDPGESNPIPRQKAPKMYNDLFNVLMKHISLAGKHPWQRQTEAF